MLNACDEEENTVIIGKMQWFDAENPVENIEKECVRKFPIMDVAFYISNRKMMHLSNS